MSTFSTICCLVFVLASDAQGNDVITCGASSSPVTEGEDAHITCYFPYDVSKFALISVAVDHYPSSSPSGSLPDKPVDCLKVNTPSFNCKVAAGFSIDGEIKESLTFSISTVSTKHDGRFLCQLMPSEEQIPDTDFCHLSVRNASGVLTTTGTTETATSTVAVAVRVDDESHADEETGNSAITVPVVISVVMSVVLAVAVVVFVRWRRRSKSANIGGKGKESVMTSLLTETSSPAVTPDPDAASSPTKTAPPAVTPTLDVTPQNDATTLPAEDQPQGKNYHDRFGAFSEEKGSQQNVNQPRTGKDPRASTGAPQSTDL